MKMLTIDEAIFLFKLNNVSIKNEYYNGEKTTEYRACQHAVEALEKQIVKEPTTITDKNSIGWKVGGTHKCKACNAVFINWDNNKTNYCGNCGQKLREEE